MRGGLIIVGIIFWISVRFEFPEQLARGGECQVSQSGRYLNRDYTTVFAGLINKGGDIPATFSILRKYPLYYFATEYDTFRLTNFTDDSFEPLQHIDFDKTFPTLDVFNKESIRSMLSQHWDSTDRFLMEVHEDGFNYIGAGKIIEAQLDFDPEAERIVQFNNEWFHSYLFYESYGSYWQFLKAIHVYDTGGNNEPDFSLDGFIGLKVWSHGTFQSSVDKTYYRVNHGQLEAAFCVNTSAYQGMLYYTDSTWIGIRSEAELLLVNSSETLVEHAIRIYSYNHVLDSNEVFYEENVTYTLKEQAGGNFLPDKTNSGFNQSFNSDSTYFFPEAYAYEELRRLKENGNAKQREILKNFVHDSTATFR
jgi:hypothetical protein